MGRGFLFGELHDNAQTRKTSLARARNIEKQNNRNSGSRRRGQAKKAAPSQNKIVYRQIRGQFYTATLHRNRAVLHPTRACARAPRSLRPPRQAWSSPRLTRRAGYPPPFTPVSRSDRGECRRARKCDGPISAVYCCGGRSSEIACGWWSSPSSLRSSLE